jgi:hypothetical protein
VASQNEALGGAAVMARSDQNGQATPNLSAGSAVSRVSQAKRGILWKGNETFVFVTKRTLPHEEQDGQRMLLDSAVLSHCQNEAARAPPA